MSADCVTLTILYCHLVAAVAATTAGGGGGRRSQRHWHFYSASA